MKDEKRDKWDKLIDQIVEVENERASRPDPYAHEDLEDQPSIRAIAALARNAEASEGNPLAPKIKVHILDTVDENKRSAHYMHSANCYLGAIECPLAARQFVTALVGISEGDHKKIIEVTDKEIASYLKVSESTIRKRRRALEQWEDKEQLMIVEIIQGDFNIETEKNDITRYRVVICEILPEILTQAQATREWARNPLVAIKQAAIKLAEDPPVDMAVKKRKKPRRDKRQDLKSKRKTILKFIEQCSKEEVKEGRSAKVWFNQLTQEAERIVEEVETLPEVFL